jgi:opacity protein-like surface antigen
MIRSLGFLFLGLLLACPASAESGDHSVGLMVGQVWPAGEIGRDLDGTVGGGLSYEFAASEVFSLYAQGVHSSHNEGALKVTSTNLGMKAHLVYYDKLAPYVLVGAGLYFVKKNVAPPPVPETAEKAVFGFHLGLGAELDVSEIVFVGLEFDIHSLFAGTATTPSGRRVEISGRWTGFFLRGGVRF